MLVRQKSEMGALVGEPGETLQGTLHRTLLEMILFGYFDRGARLYPQLLAEQFQVSLTPVREALMRLATEGYIEAVPRRGFHVRVPTAKQVSDLWHVRLGLELLAGELVIGRLERGELTASGLKPLLDIQAELDADAAVMTQHRHIELNGNFHRQLVELSDNAQLVSIYDGIQMQLLGAWVQRGLDSWRERFRLEKEDHHDIIATISSADTARYAAVARKHIARSLDGALTDLNEKLPSRSPAETVST